MVRMTGFPHSQTTNKLVNKAANDSARVSGQDRKIPPALGSLSLSLSLIILCHANTSK